MVSMDAFASAFGFDAKSDDVWTTLGKVTAVNGGTLSVLLGGSATPTECEAYCVAGVGDIVFVAITKGRARAIACKGGGSTGEYLPISGGTLTGQLEIPDSAVTDASQTPSANQYGSALHVTDQQGEQVGYLGLIHDTDDDLWTQLGVTRDVNGTPAYNSLWLGLKDDGTPTVYVGGAQQAWRGAIGASYSNATSLYDNSSGTTGTVTLSQTAANFSILEIFFCDIDGNYSSVRVWSPNGKVVSLTTSAVVGTSLFFISWTRRVKINGTSIANQAVSNYSTGRFYIYSNGTTGVQSDNYIKIVKVLGWKG